MTNNKPKCVPWFFANLATCRHEWIEGECERDRTKAAHLSSENYYDMRSILPSLLLCTTFLMLHTDGLHATATSHECMAEPHSVYSPFHEPCYNKPSQTVCRHFWRERVVSLWCPFPSHVLFQFISIHDPSTAFALIHFNSTIDLHSFVLCHWICIIVHDGMQHLTAVSLNGFDCIQYIFDVHPKPFYYSQ